MLDESQIHTLALDHVRFASRPAEGYRYTLGDKRRVEAGWYYDYKIVCDLDIPEDEKEKFAGALGFVVDNETGVVSEISHSAWVDLGLAFHSDPYGTDENNA